MIQGVPPVANPPEGGPPTRREPERMVKPRTVRGVVRDERGQPVAEVWIGDLIEPMPDVWEIDDTFKRIRVAREPYRDRDGNVVHAGSPGKYFEYRDDSGKWQPVHPDDIRGVQFGAQEPLPDEILEVRVAKGRHRMTPLHIGDRTAARTDSRGRFTIEVEFQLPGFRKKEIHFSCARLPERGGVRRRSR